MKAVGGNINGTGAAIYVGIGFIPDHVILRNLEATAPIELHWDRLMARSVEQQAGMTHANGKTVAEDDISVMARLTIGTGIAPYRGGDKLTAASTVYLIKDPAPNKINAGTLGTVTRWTLDTPANRTGKFNVGVNTTYVGEGSVVCIREDMGLPNTPKWVTMQGLTNDGDAANEVTLSEAVKNGDVLFLGGMYDFIGGSVGDVIPAGFVINSTGNINSSGETISFIAYKWDD